MWEEFQNSKGEAHIYVRIGTTCWTWKFFHLNLCFKRMSRMFVHARRDNTYLWFKAIETIWVELSNYDLELAAVVFVLKIWRHYHYGAKCEILTYHQSLKYVHTERDKHEAKTMDWTSEGLRLYDKLPSRQKNKMADALSRNNMDKMILTSLSFQPSLWEIFKLHQNWDPSLEKNVK